LVFYFLYRPVHISSNLLPVAGKSFLVGRKSLSVVCVESSLANGRKKKGPG
jgi:hypothetical protein